MPTTTKAGPSNHWLTLEADYVAPQEVTEATEAVETAPEPETVVPVPEPKKRAQRAVKPLREA